MLPHACLIAGPKGVGKRTLVRALTRMLLCEDMRGCGACSSCRLVDSGVHPDYIEIKPEAGKMSIGVDKSREMVARAHMRPSQGAHRVVAILSADLMTPEAQNALLKTLEEPPGYLTFFLLCESVETLLPTVRSRAALFRVTAPGLKEFVAIAGQNGISRERAQLLYALCEGCIGRALEMDRDKDYFSARDQALDMLGLFLSERERALPALLNYFKMKRDQALGALKMWEEFVRDAAVRGALAPIHADRDRIGPITPAAACRVADALAEAIDQIAANTNIQLACEGMLLKLLEDWK